MGVVLVLPNPFDPRERETHRTRRPQTVRRWATRTQRSRMIWRVGPDGRRYREFRQPTVCFLNGRPLLRRDWSRRIIGDQDMVTFHVLPAGGGGGSNPLAAVLMIAVAVATPYLAGLLAPMVLGATAAAAAGTLGMAALTAGVGLALGAVAYGIMSLFVQPPPPATSLNGGIANTPQASPTYNLQAQGNTARLGQPIPEAFGRTQIFPDFAAQPYQTFEGNDQYLHYLLVCSKGYLQIDDGDVRIGDTPIGNFSEITWQKVGPGDTIPPTLVDPMMITSTDLAQAELTGSEAGSPYKGPFIVNPATTTIETIEIDYGAVQGLYYVNNDSSLAARGFTLQVEIQPIDDDGDATGSWTVLDTFSESAATRTPQRWTRHYDLATIARYQVRIKRTDAKDTSSRAASEVDWVGLRGRQPGTRTYPGVTLLAMKLKATDNLTSQSSKQVNVIATRMLPTWDAIAGTMTTELTATRSPCDAFAYICLGQNGARLSEKQVALAELYAGKADYEAKGYTFDGVFDTSTTAWEAVSKIGRCVIAQPVIQGPKVRLVRDVPSTAPAMVFTPRNIKKGSFKIQYKFPDSTTPDAVEVQYIDKRSWKPTSVIVALPGSSAANPSQLQLFGCTNRAQAWDVGYMFCRANVFRRRAVPFSTEMEGLLLIYGDALHVTHDMPAWGQSAEAIAFDEATRRLTVDQPLTFTTGTHYAQLRQRDGTRAGPYTATAVAGDPHSIILGDGELPDLSLGGDEERTLLQFGPGQTYAKPLKVIGVTPRSEISADIIGIDDDPRMYEPIPPEGS